MGRLVLAVVMSALIAPGAVAGASAANLRVALVADPGGTAEAAGAADYMARMQRILVSVSLPFDVVTEQQMLRGALDRYAVAIVPYAPNLSPAGQAGLQAFASDGGKLMCFYKTYGLEGALGIRGVTYAASPERRDFCQVACSPDAPMWLPDGFAQVSWNINSPMPADGTIVLARWLNTDGKDAGRAAATLSYGGFFFSHVAMPQSDTDILKAGLVVRGVAQWLADRRGKRRDVVIVRSTSSEASGISDASLVSAMVEDMKTILGVAGVPCAVLPDEMVAGGALAGRKVAILPLNFRVVDGEVDALRAFVAAGGKVIGCFSLESQLRPLVGVAEAQFKGGGLDAPFEVVRFARAAPRTFPASFRQGSSNIMAAVPAPGAAVIATWQDGAGKESGYPAVILCPSGMYFSYILRAGDTLLTSQFMLAAIAHLAGDQFYVAAAENSLARLWQLGRYGSREELTAACRSTQRAEAAAADAVRLETEARSDVRAGRASDAFLAVRKARAAAELAAVRSLASRGGRELRGGWLHDVRVPGQDWDGFFEGMKAAHLNALFPNVCAASYAHYNSNLFPLSEFVRTNGPQVEPMLVAARRHGIEVHLWRVNYNLWSPGEEVVKRYADANRVCRDAQGNIVGGPRTASLCPSSPDNQRLEIDAMLEMTRKFHPDGIHFDYIRYPGSQACFCSGCRERFEKRIGKRLANWPQDVLRDGPLHPQYLDFRRDQITYVVGEVSRRSREIDRNVKISAAVFSDWARGARDGVGQDWPVWLERGYLDFVCPMNYTPEVDELGRTVASQRQRIGSAPPLMSGIGAWKAASPWHLAQLVDAARSNGADGLMFFDYRGRVADELIPALLEGPLAKEALTPWAP